MDCVLISMAKDKKRFIFSFILLAFLFLLCGCDPLADYYWYLEESVWLCEDPFFHLTYTRGLDGNIFSDEKFLWNETEITVDILVRSDWFEVYPKDEYSYADRLLSGTWHYRNGDLVFSLKEDFIFSSQYEELVFVRVK